MKVIAGVVLGVALTVAVAFGYSRLATTTATATTPRDPCDEVDQYVAELEEELRAPLNVPGVPDSDGGGGVEELGLTDEMMERANQRLAASRLERAKQARRLEVGTKYATLVADNPDCFSVEERVDAKVWLEELP